MPGFSANAQPSLLLFRSAGNIKKTNAPSPANTDIIVFGEIFDKNKITREIENNDKKRIKIHRKNADKKENPKGDN